MDIVTGNMGWIEVVVGPMFSGKSEELIRRLRRAEIAKQRVWIFKPAIDQRYSANGIVSHSRAAHRCRREGNVRGTAPEMFRSGAARGKGEGGRAFRFLTLPRRAMDANLARTEKEPMKRLLVGIEGLLLILALLLISHPTSASEWSTVALKARPLDITANADALWVCGADELIANSTDGGKIWNVQHLVTGGAVLLAIGAAGDRVLYAAGTGGSLLFTKDGGTTWTRMSVPASVVYAASFSDDQHGLIQTPHTIYRTSDGGASWQPVAIDLSGRDLTGFRWVRTLVALDPNHMIVVMSEGNASYYADKLLVTKDGGGTWKVLDIPSTGLSSVSAYDGEYWAAGGEVIEKDKPGGGYNVPLVMHSPDGEAWTHLVKWAPKEFSACNSQTCLFGDGSGVDFRATSPQKYWTFPSEKAVTAKWAVAHGSICSVGTELKCAAATPVAAIPADTGSPIPTRLAPPPLDAPAARGLQCISCDTERIIVTDDYQGVADVELKVRVGVNGLVENVEVVRATKPEIGDRMASQVRNWIFVPYEEGGAVHPVATTIKLRVQAVKSK